MQQCPTGFLGPAIPIAKVASGAIEDVLGVEDEAFAVLSRQEFLRNLAKPTTKRTIGTVAMYNGASYNDIRFVARAPSLIQRSYAHEIISTERRAH
jgi:hypothetical protein